MRAHVIPESFFRVLGAEDVPRLYSSRPQDYPKRAPIGVYDSSIVCGQCEQSFSGWDDYGATALINELDQLFSPYASGSETIAFVGRNIDQARLKMFFLSVLWRASVSTHAFYRRVNLGPHEDQLRAVIRSGASPDVDEYSVLMSRWIVSEERRSFIDGLMSPFLERWDGVNAYRVYFGKVVAYIKVDRRPFQEVMRYGALGVHPHTLQLAREFDDSHDFGAMLYVAKSSRGAA